MNYIRPLLSEEGQALIPEASANTHDILSFYGEEGKQMRAKHLQKHLLHDVLKKQWQRRLNAAPPLQASIMLASTAPWASSWITNPLGTDLMANRTHAYATKQRLNLAPSTSMPAHCHCGEDLSSNP